MIVERDFAIISLGSTSHVKDFLLDRQNDCLKISYVIFSVKGIGKYGSEVPAQEFALKVVLDFTK